jgi:hypothetical protein
LAYIKNESNSKCAVKQHTGMTKTQRPSSKWKIPAGSEEMQGTAVI